MISSELNFKRISLFHKNNLFVSLLHVKIPFYCHLNGLFLGPEPIVVQDVWSDQFSHQAPYHPTQVPRHIQPVGWCGRHFVRLHGTLCCWRLQFLCMFRLMRTTPQDTHKTLLISVNVNLKYKHGSSFTRKS